MYNVIWMMSVCTTISVKGTEYVYGAYYVKLLVSRFGVLSFMRGARTLRYRWLRGPCD